MIKMLSIVRAWGHVRVMTVAEVCGVIATSRHPTSAPTGKPHEPLWLAVDNKPRKQALYCMRNTTTPLTSNIFVHREGVNGDNGILSYSFMVFAIDCWLVRCELSKVTLKRQTCKGFVCSWLYHLPVKNHSMGRLKRKWHSSTIKAIFRIYLV